MARQWRRNPFTGTVFPATLQEIHTVQYYDDWNANGIQLMEGVYLDNPSSIVITENVTGGATFTEVPRATTPGTGQYRVDYDAENFSGTSRIEFNASAVGTEVVVDYRGTGLLATTDNYAEYLAFTTIPGPVTVTGDWTIGGDTDLQGTMDVAGSLTSTGAWTSQGNARYSFTATQTFSAAGNETLDCATKSLFLKTGGTATVTLSNMTEGQTIRIILSSTGSAYTITWAGETFRWAFATVPVPTATASRYDMYSFQKLGGIVYAFRTAVMG
jgi:hypothetical protein